MAVVSQPIIYLDTNHISQLARFPESKGSKAVLPILAGGEAHLAVSLLHFQELADPEFLDRERVGEFLDKTTLAWARWPMDVFKDEVDAAIARSLGTERQVAAFFDTMEAAWGMPEEAVVVPSAALEEMAAAPELRDGMLRSKRGAAQLDAALKGSAAVMADPLQPLLAHMREEHDLRQTPAGIRLPRPLDPEEVIARVGGVAALPAYQVYQAMHRTRLGDSKFQTTGNDIVDELHACYGPYVSALLVDKTTLGRLRSLRPGWIRSRNGLGTQPPIVWMDRNVRERCCG